MLSRIAITLLAVVFSCGAAAEDRHAPRTSRPTPAVASPRAQAPAVKLEVPLPRVPATMTVPPAKKIEIHQSPTVLGQTRVKAEVSGRQTLRYTVTEIPSLGVTYYTGDIRGSSVTSPLGTTTKVEVAPAARTPWGSDDE